MYDVHTVCSTVYVRGVRTGCMYGVYVQGVCTGCTYKLLCTALKIGLCKIGGDYLNNNMFDPDEAIVATVDKRKFLLKRMKRFSCQKENVVSIKHYEHKTQHYLSESITLCHLC